MDNNTLTIIAIIIAVIALLVGIINPIIKSNVENAVTKENNELKEKITNIEKTLIKIKKTTMPAISVDEEVANIMKSIDLHKKDEKHLRQMIEWIEFVIDDKKRKEEIANTDS